MLDWKRKKQKREVEERQASNGVIYLAFPALEKSGVVKHGFSTRFGGVSQGCFSSMNLSLSKPDKATNVRTNFQRMAQALDVSYESLTLAYQVHSTNVRVLGKEDRGFGITKERPYRDVDGLVTNQREITLVSFFADCIPLYFVDSKNHAIGLAHSGWRGTLQKIGQRMFETMQREYGTEAEHLLACIGPGICMDCYEVGDELYQAFQSSFDPCSLGDIFVKKSNTKYHLNLMEANKRILLQLGVLEENIHVSDICTHCNSDYLFSHRKHGENRGNLAAFLALR